MEKYTDKQLARAIRTAADDEAQYYRRGELLAAEKRVTELAEENTKLAKALEANEHIVTVTRSPSDQPYTLTVRAEAAIVSPRLYFAELRFDAMLLTLSREDPVPHYARSLVESLTHEWRNELMWKTASGLRTVVEQYQREFV